MKGWICCCYFILYYKYTSYYYKINLENHISSKNDIINNGIYTYKDELIFKNKEDIIELLQYDMDIRDNDDYKIYINKIYVKNYKIIDKYYNLDRGIFLLDECRKIKFPTIRPLEDSIFVYPKERVYI